MTLSKLFRGIRTGPEIIRLAAKMYLRFPLPLRNAEALLPEREIDVSHEPPRFCWRRFGPKSAAEIGKAGSRECRLAAEGGTLSGCS